MQRRAVDGLAGAFSGRARRDEQLEVVVLESGQRGCLAHRVGYAVQLVVTRKLRGD